MYKIKRTKIVCTMGPACDSDETIREMIKAGMNVARFNFSHGSYDEHHDRIERVRRIFPKELGLPVGILLDTKGPRSAPAFWLTAKERLPSRPATKSSFLLSPRPRISTAPLSTSPSTTCSALRGRERLPHPDR